MFSELCLQSIKGDGGRRGVFSRGRESYYFVLLDTDNKWVSLRALSAESV